MNMLPSPQRSIKSFIPTYQSLGSGCGKERIGHVMMSSGRACRRTLGSRRCQRASDEQGPRLVNLLAQEEGGRLSVAASWQWQRSDGQIDGHVLES
ncbi:predicted protein [Plenodomus lingam JN3]|uniref:Predicted protein n=1 Tax=Leptosphaeria maculans (strain JN3 / isolate v23.1.3 / race Av1-4-5-6-7-8) TaxID=985895 RepID=E4ZI26_LEPMJ|nr:predicted protein [Plenodomus lingam JN3]CBX91169.1 predicted protein [Plenodomus lingam JN3]